MNMLRFLQIIIVGMCSILDVRVRASSNAESLISLSVLDLPTGCLTSKNTGACALSVRPGHRYFMNVGNARLAMGSQSSVLLSGQSLKFLTGQMLIESQDLTQVDTIYGVVEVAEKSTALLWKEAENIQIAVLSGIVLVRPTGSRQKFQIQEGFKNWIGRIDHQGQPATGLPAAPQFNQLIALWAQLTDLKREEFSAAVQRYVPLWKTASAQAAKEHQIVFERRLAVVQEEERRRSVQRAQTEAEQSRIRRLFRQKVLNP